MRLGEKSEKISLSEAETNKLTILSYQLSQGLPSLQKILLEYICGALAERGEKIDPQVFLDVCAKIREHMLQRMVRAGVHREGGSIDGEKKQVEENYLPKIKEEGRTDELISDIARTMFQRDKRFAKEGRSNQKEQGRKFLEYYGRDGNSTGHEILDDLMKKVWAYRSAKENAFAFYELERD